MSRRKAKEFIDVIHKAPGKRGKQEYRRFESLDDAWRYVERQTGRTHGAPSRVNELDGYVFRYKGSR